jgi:uncharacterized protein (DUF2225 family)
VVRRHPGDPTRLVEIARLGPGEVIGELAPILDRARNATVQAVEPTDVLEVPLDRLSALLARQPALQRVLVLALKERTAMRADQVVNLTHRVGLNLPPEVLAAADRGRVLRPPAFNHDFLYAKTVECPACGVTFSALVPRARKPVAAARSTDFHQRYSGPVNPYDYDVWVCPNDLYAAFPGEWDSLGERYVPHVRQAAAEVLVEWGGEVPDFNAERGLDAREKALALSLAQYDVRKVGVLRRAAVLHRLAWCARERHDDQAELRWLAEALKAYTTAYRHTDLGEAKEELRVLYLCGELSVRLGDASGATDWFSQGLQHPAIGEQSIWQRALQDRLTAVDAGGASPG